MPLGSLLLLLWCWAVVAVGRRLDRGDLVLLDPVLVIVVVVIVVVVVVVVNVLLDSSLLLLLLLLAPHVADLLGLESVSQLQHAARLLSGVPQF